MPCATLSGNCGESIASLVIVPASILFGLHRKPPGYAKFHGKLGNMEAGLAEVRNWLYEARGDVRATNCPMPNTDDVILVVGKAVVKLKMRDYEAEV